MTTGNIVGIDLGTTFCSVARLDDRGRLAVAVQNDTGQLATPSVVYVGTDGVDVGQRALELGEDDPHGLIFNPKRYLGEDVSWEIHGRVYTPVDASAYILKKLKADTEAVIGPIAQAVVSVPAHFDARRRALTLKAAKQAGLKVLDLVNEPVAAAMSHVFDPNLGMDYAALMDDEDSFFAVYDLGGGTFDLSIVRVSPQEVQVLATTGDLKLGGIDWNKILGDYLSAELERQHSVTIQSEGDQLNLRNTVESVKLRLSDDEASDSRKKVPVAIECDGRTYTIPATRDVFEGLTSGLVERTRQLTNQLLKTYGRGKVDEVVVVGGASRMPMIGRMIRSLPGIAENRALSPELSVAQGAAYYAGKLLGANDDPAIEFRNVCARSLGLPVRVSEGKYKIHTVIPANTTLPANARITVATVRPGQSRITLKIVESDDSYERDKPVICKCILENLPADLPAGALFDVEFSYDRSGRLQIVSRHRDSGLLATVHHSLLEPAEVAGS